MDNNNIPAFTVANREATHPVMLVCEHASDYIPRAYNNLGLPPGEQREHIGWDIGAYALAKELSKMFQATLVSANYSRLLIDLNRPVEAKDSIPEVSDNKKIPGNMNLSKREVEFRIENFFLPFHDEVSKIIDARKKMGIHTKVIGVHSFTPTMNGEKRPWEVGVLYGDSTLFAKKLIDKMRESGVVTGDNEPYKIHVDEDMTVPVHGDSRGLESILLEVRNDLISNPHGVNKWAEKIAPLI